MFEDESCYERRLNGLLFDAANKTDEFVRDCGAARRRSDVIGMRSG